MRFKDQVVVFRRTLRKTVNDQIYEFLHFREWGMYLKTCIMFELQQGNVVGVAAGSDARGTPLPLDGQERHQKQTFCVKCGFAVHGQRAMCPERRVAPVPEHQEPVISRPVKDMLAHVAPLRRRRRHIDIGPRQPVAHFSDAQVH